MSATNRGATRRESDYYRTPPEAINAFLNTFEFSPFLHVLEPCAGDGAIIREIAKRTKKLITAVEIRKEKKTTFSGPARTGCISAIL